MRRQSQNAFARPRGLGPFLRRWTIPILGAVTPVGLIVVNIAAFIVHHLTEFRWTIAVLAFVSGLMLNSWTALKIYRTARRHYPDHSWLHDTNQELVLIGGMAIVIILAFVTALFCYLGLESEKDLPNASTFITGVVAIAIPILLQALFARDERGSPKEMRVGSVVGAPPGEQP